MADLNWREAITNVLKGEAEPVHYAEIAEKIVAQGLKTQVGATPAASVAAELSTSLKQDGADSPFERVSRGYYRLRSTGATPAPEEQAAKAEEDAAEPEAGLVNAFGMYWRREFAVWTPPRLLGQQQPGSTPVDFTQQRGVYLLHDRREVVYVGRTTDQGLGDRLKQHTINRLNGRWDRFSWFGVYPVSEDGNVVTDAALAFSLDNLIATMEALLIEGLEPPQNRKRGDGFSAVEFLQVPDPDLIKKQQEQLLDQLKKNL
jgi:hypothetical protein